MLHTVFLLRCCVSPKHKGYSNALSVTKPKGMSMFSPWSHEVHYKVFFSSMPFPVTPECVGRIDMNPLMHNVLGSIYCLIISALLCRLVQEGARLSQEDVGA